MADTALIAPRRPRALLFVLALAVPGLAALSYLANVPTVAPTQVLAPLAVVAMTAVVVFVWVRVKIPTADLTIFSVMLALTGIGLVMVARLDPARYPKQVVWVCLALVVTASTAVFVRRTEKLASYQYVCGLGAIVLVLLPAMLHALTGGRGDVTADEVNGARLWIQFGGFFSLQPSEFAKILVAIFLAGYLTEKGDVLAEWPYRLWGRIALPPLRHAAPILLVWLASLGLLAAQKDLGCALLVFCLFLEMLFSATGRAGYPLVGLVLFAAGASAAIHLGGQSMFGHVQTRIDAWMNPWADAHGGGYQMLRSLFALAQGDVLGTGIGRGLPTSIPEVSTDFIFSAVAEELGLVGGCAVILCYSLLVVRGFVAGGRAKDDFSALLAAGITAGLVTQAAIIICGVTKFLPMTGITLPFVSYGGSSIVASGIAIGLLIRISADPTPLPRPAGARPRTRPLAWLHLFVFLVLSVWLAYWQVYRGPALNVSPDNPRLATMSQRVKRGRILDRHGAVVAATDEKTGARVYPAARATAHVVGYNDPRYGATGVEAAAAGWLLGLPEPTESMRDLLQAVQRGFHGLPQRGSDVVLTIDLRLQRTGSELLGSRRGAIAALNPRTGEVRCLVSRPTFDPTNVGAALAEASSPAGQKASPLLNRATQGLYPPGSTFKILVAAAALDARLISPEDTFECKGEEIIRNDRIRCSARSGHGVLRLDEAITHSCNIYFAHVGERFLTAPGGRGAQLFQDYCESFGFEASPPVGLSIEPSRVPKGRDMTDAMVLECSFGQGALQVTPLQMALIAAGIGNHGDVMVPQIISEVRDPGGRTVDRLEPVLWRHAVRREAADWVAKVMRRVVTEGTGGAAALPGVAVAGKTGTAENPTGAAHSWFVCFAPADDPEIAVAVIVEHGGHGASVAARIAREIMRTYFAQ